MTAASAMTAASLITSAKTAAVTEASLMTAAQSAAVTRASPKTADITGACSEPSSGQVEECKEEGRRMAESVGRQLEDRSGHHSNCRYPARGTPHLSHSPVTVPACQGPGAQLQGDLPGLPHGREGEAAAPVGRATQATAHTRSVVDGGVTSTYLGFQLSLSRNIHNCPSIVQVLL